MEFANISATGTFDGIIPMFRRARRAHRRRPSGRAAGGGTLSYIGELTDKELGAYGKLAFDALKALRYSKLTIDLNGSLEGEFVAGIELDGSRPRSGADPCRRAASARHRRPRARPARQDPVRVQHRGRGPFRALIGMMRSFEDPSAPDPIGPAIRSAAPSDLDHRSG